MDSGFFAWFASEIVNLFTVLAHTIATETVVENTFAIPAGTAFVLLVIAYPLQFIRREVTQMEYGNGLFVVVCVGFVCISIIGGFLGSPRLEYIVTYGANWILGCVPGLTISELIGERIATQ